MPGRAGLRLLSFGGAAFEIGMRLRLIDTINGKIARLD